MTASLFAVSFSPSAEIFLLLDNLLKWAKNRLNKQHVYKQQTDINSIIDSTAEMYVPMAAQKGVKINPRKSGIKSW